ncbi:MAG: FtsX-like permease family protein [Maribacter sp.]|uniref:ABC transporter permease n=1 Tax=Maribacter sp. TaxID=1897614 RepID=UPI003C72DE81
MNAIKSYIRHLVKNKLYTAVTIIGFAISLTFILLLSVYIGNEQSVDNFHVNKDRLYRLENESVDFSPPIAEDLKNSIPEIKDFTRVLDSEGRINVADGQKLKISYLGVDASFFDMFSFPLVHGKPDEVLQTANSIVLSKSMAMKLFGTIDVVGKSVFLDTVNKFTITGIMDDFPENTHFTYQDALVNLMAFKALWGFENIMQEYGFASLSIYLLAKENADLPAKASSILEKFKKDYWLYTEGWATTVELTPLKDLYFSNKVGNGTKSNSKSLVTILSFIVLLILLLAVGNYVNLTIAQATFRGKEVAIKKLLGSSKRQLFLQFIRESVLLCFTAVLLSLFLAKLIEPVFDSLLHTRLHLNDRINLPNLVVFIPLFALIGVLSGILPAIKIAGFRPIEVVKGTFRTKVKSIYGKAFITFQYTVTIALLACSWIILKQTDFLRNQDLGFQKDNIVHMEYLGATDKKGTIKNALLQIPGVEDVTITWQSPLSGGSNQTFESNGKSVSFQEFAVDSSFFHVFNMKVKPSDVAYSDKGMYLNETAIKELGLTDEAISFKMEENEIPILGIVNDFNFKELRDNIGPLMIRQQTPNFQADDIFLKVNGTNVFDTADKIKTTYASLVENAEFDITFVDDAINQWYEKDERTGKIIGYFTLLSFIISAMGILAMSTFYMQQRKKEISIRKVNGATISQILSLLNKDFVKWVALAFVIAVPVSWYAMNQWLEGFAYKTTMNWWVFAMAGVAALAIALLTVSWQSFRAAVANPVDALKEE